MDLPIELLSEISLFLQQDDFFSFVQTCKVFHSLLNAEQAMKRIFHLSPECKILKIPYKIYNLDLHHNIQIRVPEVSDIAFYNPRVKICLAIFTKDDEKEIKRFICQVARHVDYYIAIDGYSKDKQFLSWKRNLTNGKYQVKFIK